VVLRLGMARSLDLLRCAVLCAAASDCAALWGTVRYNVMRWLPCRTVLRCDARCGALPYGAMQCGTVRCHTVLRRASRCGAVWFSAQSGAVLHGAVPRSAVRFSAVPWGAAQPVRWVWRCGIVLHCGARSGAAPRDGPVRCHASAAVLRCTAPCFALRWDAVRYRGGATLCCALLHGVVRFVSVCSSPVPHCAAL
jgi:hypothetical protein